MRDLARNRAKVRRWRERNPGRAQLWTRRTRAARMEMLRRYKLAAGCIDCGYNAHPSALDFDHVRGEKQFSIASNITTTPAKLLAELEKCVVRCANCHRIKTYPTK